MSLNLSETWVKQSSITVLAVSRCSALSESRISISFWLIWRRMELTPASSSSPLALSFLRWAGLSLSKSLSETTSPSTMGDRVSTPSSSSDREKFSFSAVSSILLNSSSRRALNFLTMRSCFFWKVSFSKRAGISWRMWVMALFWASLNLRPRPAGSDRAMGLSLSSKLYR